MCTSRESACIRLSKFCMGGIFLGYFLEESQKVHIIAKIVKNVLWEIFFEFWIEKISQKYPPQSENLWMYQDWSGLLLNKKIIVRSLLDDFLSYLKVPLHFFRKSVRAHGFLRWRSDWNSWKNHGFWSTDFIQTEILMHWR